MKVLSSPGPWSLTVTCHSCKSQLLVEEGDVKVGTFDACYYAGDNGERLPYVECPVCETDLRLKWSSLPPVVTRRLHH